MWAKEAEISLDLDKNKNPKRHFRIIHEHVSLEDDDAFISSVLAMGGGKGNIL